jgi:hypothetical protein
MTRTLLALALVLAPGFVRQDPAPKPAETAPDPYPPARHASVLRFFCLEGELKADPIRKALAELGTKDAECRIAYAPQTAPGRKAKSFFAIEAPSSVSGKDVEKALRRGADKVEDLACSCFDGPARELPNVPTGPGDKSGWSARDFVIGMMSGLRWFDRLGGWTQFFYTPGKADAAEIADRYKKLVGPWGGGELGKIPRESFAWPLAAPVDEAAAKRAEKAIAKIDGVKEARIDVAGAVLRVTFELDGIKTSAVEAAPAAATDKPKDKPEAADPASAAPAAPKVRFDTNPVLDALEKEKLGPARGK